MHSFITFSMSKDTKAEKLYKIMDLESTIHHYPEIISPGNSPNIVLSHTIRSVNVLIWGFLRSVPASHFWECLVNLKSGRQNRIHLAGHNIVRARPWCWWWLEKWSYVDVLQWWWLGICSYVDVLHYTKHRCGGHLQPHMIPSLILIQMGLIIGLKFVKRKKKKEKKMPQKIVKWRQRIKGLGSSNGHEILHIGRSHDWWAQVDPKLMSRRVSRTWDLSKSKWHL